VKRIRFRDPGGAVRTGVLEDGEIVAGGRTYDPDADEVDVLPPCEPTKIVCIGRNYADHAAEHDADVPDRPLLFLKGPNAVAAPGGTVQLPAGTAGKRIEHEAELGAVIDTRCRNVSEDEATSVLAGFTCVNDLSNRDDQRREQNWIRGKAFDGAAPLGPVLATPDEVPDDASIRLWVNGEIRQEGNRDQMVFSVTELIAEISRYLTLEPGDVIATGTPEGVGPLDDGDRVRIEIEGVGTLANRVRLG
jgi:2-keto-4-pentenoate hydratase/2-oxohepta-3-ene-1,7-dioic acid hydratase in catechol pathway